MPAMTETSIENKTANGKSGKTAPGIPLKNRSNEPRWTRQLSSSSIATASTALKQIAGLKITAAITGILEVEATRVVTGQVRVSAADLAAAVFVEEAEDVSSCRNRV